MESLPTVAVSSAHRLVISDKTSIRSNRTGNVHHIPGEAGGKRQNQNPEVTLPNKNSNKLF